MVFSNNRCKLKTLNPTLQTRGIVVLKIQIYFEHNHILLRNYVVV